MDPSPSYRKNHYSRENQEAHIERALAFKKPDNHHCPSNVCLPIISLCVSCYTWLTSPISLNILHDETDQEISDDDREHTWELTLSFDITEDNLTHEQEVLYLDQVRQDKSIPCKRGLLPNKQRLADTVIACPPLPHFRNLPAARAPPLLKRQMSSCRKKFSESDHLSSARALLLPNQSTGDYNLPQCKASSD